MNLLLLLCFRFGKYARGAHEGNLGKGLQRELAHLQKRLGTPTNSPDCSDIKGQPNTSFRKGCGSFLIVKESHIWSKASGLLVSFQMSWPLLLHNPSGCQLEPNLMSLDIGMKQHQQPLNCFLCSIRCKCIFSSLPGLHLMVSRIHSLRVRSFQKWPLPEEGERPVVAWQFFFPILHQEITQEMSASLNICQQNEVHEPLLFPQMTCNQVFFSQKSIKPKKLQILNALH